MPPPSADDELDRLRRLLRERAAGLATSALAQNGSVAREDIQSLQNLSELCDALESTRPKRRSPRWAPALAFVLALGVASLLLFRNVTSTVVEVNVTSSSGQFRLAQEQMLTGASPVTSIRLIGVEKLLESPCPAALQDSAPDLTIAAESPKSPAALTLQPVTGKKGLSVEVHATNSPDRWELAFTGAPLIVKVTVEGTAKLNDARCAPPDAFPRTLEARLDERMSRLLIEFPPGAEPLFPALLPVDSIAFVRTDFVESQGQRQASTVLGGTIFFEDLGKESKLRDGEWLEIATRGIGFARPPRQSGPSLMWRYRAAVESLKSGPADSQRDLKPSWLKYGQAQHGLGLLWGTALSLFGLGATFLRWWKPGS